MIKLELSQDYEARPVSTLGTVYHKRFGVACGINWNYKSKLPIRRYLCGLEPPNYPVPAIRLEVEYDVNQNSCFIAVWEKIVGDYDNCTRCYYKR